MCTQVKKYSNLLEDIESIKKDYELCQAELRKMWVTGIW